ncbi:MAG: hypothetical protein ACOVRK_13545 [Chryseobacterium taeanense]
MIKKIVFLFMLFSVVFSYSQTKQDKIKELIFLSGIFPISKDVTKQVISTYKKKYENVPESVWSLLEQKISIDGLINNVIEIYSDRFTEPEIDELLLFYNRMWEEKLFVFQRILYMKFRLHRVTGQ